MTIDVIFLNAESAFSQDVFKRIRPSIPREKWPHEPLRATFTAVGDGVGLFATFADLPTAYGQVAARLVFQAGVELVVKSPVALLAGHVIRAKRWRDAFMFAAVPLLFAIPLMSVLSKAATFPAAGLFSANLLCLALTHAQLTRRRMALGAGRFVAEIPVPGMRLHVASRK